MSETFISSWGNKFRYCCVVSETGEYRTLVLVQIMEDPETGEETDCVKEYSLKEDEHLIDAPAPTTRPYAGAAGFVSPVWDDGAWTEGASEEEIAAWEAEHPAPELPEPEPSGSMEKRVADLEAGKADKSEVAAVWDQMAEAYREGVQVA